MHRNIRGLFSKNDELMCSWVTNQINPHFICLLDHFLSKQTLSFVTLQNYSSCSGYLHSFSRWWCLYIYQKGCHLYSSWYFWKVWWANHGTVCCASSYKFSHLIIILNYRSHSGNFDQFLALLESTMKHI